MRVVPVLLVFLVGATSTASAQAVESLEDAERAIAECAGGRHQACYDGYGYLHAHAPERERSTAETQCAAGVAYGCATFGDLLARANPPDPRGVVLLEQACDRGESYGCQRLGYCAELGDCGIPRDTRRSVDLYARGCVAGEPHLCSWAVDNLVRPRSDVAPRPGEIEELWRIGCDRGDDAACYRVAFARLRAVPPGTAAPSRVELLGRCARGEGAACDDLGVQASVGIGGPVDASVAIPALRSACSAAHLPGCHHLAMHFLNGSMVTRSRENARALLDRACTGGYGPSCFALADLLVEQSSTEQRDAWLVRACELGEPLGCRIQALLARRPGVPLVGAPRAAAVRACTLGDPLGCLLSVANSGDEAASQRALDVACAFQLPGACR